MRSVKWGEPGYRAFLGHRLTGLALALFVPFHLLTLGLALESEQALEDALAWFDRPLVKFAEWALVIALTLHLALGVRVLALELGTWRGHRLGMASVGVSVSLAVGVLFWALV